MFQITIPIAVIYPDVVHCEIGLGVGKLPGLLREEHNEVSTTITPSKPDKLTIIINIVLVVLPVRHQACRTEATPLPERVLRPFPDCIHFSPTMRSVLNNNLPLSVLLVAGCQTQRLHIRERVLRQKKKSFTIQQLFNHLSDCCLDEWLQF